MVVQKPGGERAWKPQESEQSGGDTWISPSGDWRVASTSSRGSRRLALPLWSGASQDRPCRICGKDDSSCALLTCPNR